ncbi:MAG: ATP-dependent zinc metalloprotease FtsH [Parcubacteria group bacterium]|nr:ATP-dependent zinc metalloprotease FtsH [Parcubacteria group bacterium]
MKSFIKNILIAFVVFLTIASIFAMYKTPLTEPEEMSLDKLVTQINEEDVEKMEIQGEEVKVKIKDDNKEKKVKKEKESPLGETLQNYGVESDKLAKIEIKIVDESGFSYWMGALLPFLLPFGLIAIFIYFMARSMQKGNNRAMMFGQSQAKKFEGKDENKTSFKDVAGVKEAKEELLEVVEFLKTPKKFTDLGAEIPKGVLLIGPPGTGKTLMARAVAGEAKVPFFHISGSEFVEMFVGVGASRVRDLFNKAKKAAPAILFIDEIDAVGRQRGAGLGGSHDEREQTLNQILTEMDGFEQGTNVIVIAATNRPDVLDPALLRPGRFDRRVTLNLPDIKDREELLKIYARGKKLVQNVNLKKVAQRTPGFSGADIKNLMNEAAILAARRDKKTVGEKEVLEAIEKVMLGPERKSFVLSEQEKKIAAYHEAGHALVSHLLPHTDPVHKISIISRGQAAGYTLKLPEEEKHFHAKQEFIEDLSVLLGGYVAEKIVFGDVTTGATSDLREVSKLTRKLVTEYGMSDKLGPMTFGQKDEMVFLGRDIAEQRDYSEEIAFEIDKEIRSFVDLAHKKTGQIITRNQGKLELIAKTLMEKETLEREDFEKLVGKKEKSK